MGKDQIWSFSHGRDKEDLGRKSSRKKGEKRFLEKETVQIM
mgnify:CR=1 FL=1